MTGAGSEIAARAEATGIGARPAGLWGAPELPVVFFSFLPHFVWEFVQVPTYATWPRWGNIPIEK